jgi:hypothetical protein
MNKPPISSRGCCLPNNKGLSYLNIGSERHVVGMMNLDIVFQKLLALGRQPDAATDEELVSLARKFNYISSTPSVQADYAVALRKAYAVFYTSQEQ